MKNKKRLVLSLVFVFFVLGVSLPLFMINHKKVKAQAITNLTNTTWTFNNSISSSMGNTRYYINFYLENSQSSTFTGILCPNTGTILYYNGNNLTNAYQVGAWNSNDYKTITITGGTDATNTILISWLESNATQQGGATTTQITHKYWSPYGVIQMQDDEVIGDDDIEYTILYNEYTNTTTETLSTGLMFYGIDTDSGNEYYSAIISYTGGGLNLLYAHDNSNNIDNAMWLEFTYGDYIDTQLYDFMSEWGLWFDDDKVDAYLVGMNQGYAEGTLYGRALGQADGVEYTNLIARIFNGIGSLLSIQVFPNITIGLIIGLPLLLGVFIIIIKILRG